MKCLLYIYNAIASDKRSEIGVQCSASFMFFFLEGAKYVNAKFNYENVDFRIVERLRVQRTEAAFNQKCM